MIDTRLLPITGVEQAKKMLEMLEPRNNIVGLAFISKKLLQAYESWHHFAKSWTAIHNR
jgi:hypothetical protein